MATGGIIAPLPAHERLFEIAMRKVVLTPMVRDLQKRWLSAGVSYVTAKQQLDALEIPQGLDAAAEAAARKHMMKLRAYHIKKWRMEMTQHLGVRANVFQNDQYTEIMVRRIAENVSLIKTIPPRFHAGLAKKLVELQGTTPFDQAKLMRILQQEYGSSGYNVRRLTRDQTSKTIGDFNRVRQMSAGVEQYIWATSNDERVRPLHAELEGQTFSWHDSPPDGHPGEAIQCFPAGTPILPAGLQASVAYRYVGELVEVETANGIRIATTPNHPILTESGWRRASDLCEGDKLLQRPIRERLSARGLDPNGSERYAVAEELHELLSGHAVADRAHASAMDLHGDSLLRQEDVEIVFPPRELLDHFEALSRQIFGYLWLELSEMSQTGLTLPSRGVLDVGALGGVSSLLVGGSGESPSLVGGELLHPESVGFAGGARSQAELAQAGGDHIPADSKSGGDLFGRLLCLPSTLDFGMQSQPAFSVSLIRRIRRFPYDGIVHNFQTSTGIIIANGFVTHNCRCVAMPIFPPRPRSVAAIHRGGLVPLYQRVKLLQQGKSQLTTKQTAQKLQKRRKKTPPKPKRMTTDEAQDYYAKQELPYRDEMRALEKQMEKHSIYSPEYHALRDKYRPLEKKYEAWMESAKMNEHRARLAHGKLNADKVTYEFKGNFDPALKRLVLEGVKEFDKMVVWTRPQKILFRLTSDSRSSQWGVVPGGYSEINVSKYLKGRSGVSTIVHELGHAYDQASREFLKESIHFLYSRTKKEHLQSMNSLVRGNAYAEKEKARPDLFINPYQGKVYPEPGAPIANPWPKGKQTIRASENTSMGIQLMWQDPVRLAREDPFTFRFIWERMMGRHLLDVPL